MPYALYPIPTLQRGQGAGVQRHLEYDRGYTNTTHTLYPIPPCSVAKALVFSDTWNAIVEELHIVDLLSKKELRNLVFQHLPIDDSIEVRQGLRALMLGLNPAYVAGSDWPAGLRAGEGCVVHQSHSPGCGLRTVFANSVEQRATLPPALL